jgi:hypothetical protein
VCKYAVFGARNGPSIVNRLGLVYVFPIPSIAVFKNGASYNLNFFQDIENGFENMA